MGSRRDQIQMTEVELSAFLEEQRIVQVATVGPNGRPHVVPLWYVVDGRGWEPGPMPPPRRRATSNATRAPRSPSMTASPTRSFEA